MPAPTNHIDSIDAALFADSCDTPEFRADFAAADEDTQRAVVGYLNTYAGPWGLKASEEDAVLGIIHALWPEWAMREPSSGIYKFRADDRLGAIADAMFEDCGETPVVALVARTVTQLRPLITSGESLDEQRRRLPDTQPLPDARTNPDHERGLRGLAVEAITDTHSQLALALAELARVNAENERLRAELERCQLGDYPPPVQSSDHAGPLYK